MEAYFVQPLHFDIHRVPFFFFFLKIKIKFKKSRESIHIWQYSSIIEEGAQVVAVFTGCYSSPKTEHFYLPYPPKYIVEAERG